MPTFRIASCGKALSQQVNEAERQKDFFAAIRKIGDLEVLNDIGAGKTGQVLRTLSKLSDSIRTGRGAFPSIIGQAADNLEAGAAWVLGQVGISDAMVQTVKNLKPEVANQALGQAKAIFQKIKQGNFTLDDVPEFFSDIQNLEILARGIYQPKGENVPADLELTTCASPYATDLIRYAPKYKFMFVVQFEFSTDYAPLKELDFAFVIKNSTRPNVEFEYEDINMYNFRTKIIKKAMYPPIDMRFYDDDYNQAMLFYNAYLKSISPIANMDFEGTKSSSTGLYEDLPMEFNNLNKDQRVQPATVTTHPYAASIGPLVKPTTKTVLSRIAIFHIYRQGRLMNIYNFYNPRIEKLGLDDLDMANNAEGNEVSLSFSYDGMYLIPGITMDPELNKRYNIEQINRGGMLPLKYNGMKDTGTVGDPHTAPYHTVDGGGISAPIGGDISESVAGTITGSAGGPRGTGFAAPFEWTSGTPGAIRLGSSFKDAQNTLLPTVPFATSKAPGFSAIPQTAGQVDEGLGGFSDKVDGFSPRSSTPVKTTSPDNWSLPQYARGKGRTTVTDNNQAPQWGIVPGKTRRVR